MTENEIKELLNKSPDLQPSKNLKQDIMNRAENVQNNQNIRQIHSKLSYSKIIAVAACILLVFALALTGGVLNFAQTDTVYMDVNPSIGLKINVYGRVTGLEFYENSEFLENQLNVKNKSVEDAVLKIMSVYDDMGILQDAEVYLSCSGNKKNQRILDGACKKASGYSSKYGYNFNVCKNKFDKKDTEDAKEYNISPGKYSVITEILALDSGYDIQELKDKPMRELKAILQQLQNQE